MLRELVDGIDFYETIVDMGEEITFLTKPEIKQFASIAPHRTTNTTDGSYWYTGAMTFDSVEQQNSLIGEYFTRQTNPVPKNILTAVMPENTTDKMATVYSVECNETIDVFSHFEGTGEYNEYGEEIEEPVYLARNVDCYMTVTLSKLEDTVPGKLVKTISTFILPAKITLSENNIIFKKDFVFNPKTNKNEYTDVKYTIESIDTSMMDVVDGKFVGVLKCMATKDIE